MLLGTFRFSCGTKSFESVNNNDDSRPVCVLKKTLENFDSDISGLVKVGDALLVTSKAKPFIYIYSVKENLRRICSVRVPTLNRAKPGLVHLGTRKDGTVDLAVAEGYGHDLHFVSLNKCWEIVGHRTRQPKLGYVPQCMGMDKLSGHLVMCDTGNRIIHTYDTSGREIGTVKLSRREFKFPVCAVKVWGGFAIADRNCKQVIIINNVGEVKAKYSGPKHNEVLDPVYLAVDQEMDHVLVVDYDGRSIQEIDQQGKWVRTLLQEKDKIECPRRICLGEDGMLYTGHGHPGYHLMITRYTRHSLCNIQEVKVNSQFALSDD